MIEDLNFRLADVLYARYLKEGSWDSLEKAIAEVNDGDRLLDRRKLKQLCYGKDIKLKISEFKALDKYLRQFDEGLAEKPIFSRQENILDSIRESHGLIFFIAVKYFEDLKTESVSRWDMRGLILLNNTRPVVLPPDIQDVPRGDSVDQIEWVKKLKKEKAKISIGSPLANSATEYLLAKMVDREPFQKAPLNTKKRLPFYFYFQDIKEKECPSTFFLNKEEAKELSKGKEEIIDTLVEDQRAVIIGNDLYKGKRKEESYAILVAQREPNEQAIMVLCGVYGPSTYGLAQIVSRGKITRQLPKLNPKEEIQPILISVVETTIKEEIPPNGNPSKKNQENLFVSKAEVVRPPKLFHYFDGNWEEE